MTRRLRLSTSRVRLAVALSLVMLGVLALPGCASRQAVPDVHVQGAGTRLPVDDRLAGDPAVEGLIAPYRAEVEAKMGEPLAFSPVPMETDEPEGLLGALAADIVLARAREETGLAVDACVLNNGGLRRSLPPGTITLGLIYEVMPFDNAIVVLRLSAEQVRSLADQIASQAGEPVSGIAFAISEKRATDLRVGGAPLESRDYWVATSDYLAGGGGGMPALWEAQESRAAGVMIRDALVDAMRSFGARGDAAGLGSVPVPDLGRIR